MSYHYRRIHVQRGGWSDAVAAFPGAYGVWRNEIGWYNDDGVVMSTEPLPNGLPNILIMRDEPLTPTVRPTSDEPPTEDGIYAHRWFEIAPTNVDEFIDLSAGAWPSFEETFGVRVVGLWRRAPFGDVERLLLITRYPSLAVWEASRPYSPDPDAGAEEARRRFVRRAEITVRTGVTIARLVRP